MAFVENYLNSANFEFRRYKLLGDQTFEQLLDAELQWTYNPFSNSIAIVVKHMVGNMLSRWTNLLTEDGEKEWRNRDNEFNTPLQTKVESQNYWDNGWNCLFEALDSISEENNNTKVLIRNEPHSITEAVNRQLAHYAYHVGQIVFIGKLIKGDNWQSLSIPKGGSAAFNKSKFGL